MAYLLVELFIVLVIVLVVGAALGFMLAKMRGQDTGFRREEPSAMFATNVAAAIDHNQVQWCVMSAVISKQASLKLAHLQLASAEAFLDYLERFDSCSDAASALDVEDYDLVALRDIAKVMKTTEMSANDVVWLGAKNIHSLTDLSKINAVDIQDDSVDDKKMTEITRWITQAKASQRR